MNNSLHSLLKSKPLYKTFYTEKETLYNIANKCPYSDGDAVYAARSLYNIINHTAFFDDDQICNAVATFKKEQAKKKITADFKVTVSPNPSSSVIDIVVKGSNEDVLLSIYNSLGQQIEKVAINKYVEIDISSLPTGLYTLHFLTTAGLKYTTPLIVTK